MHRWPLIAALCCAAAAHGEEYSLKDFSMGSDLRAEAIRSGARCGVLPAGILGETCWASGSSLTDVSRTIGGSPTKTIVLAGYDNRLGSVRFTFEQQHFSSIKAALLEKYPALKCLDSIVQNSMGASFEQTECKAVGASTTLELTRRARNLSEGLIEVASHEYLSLVDEAIKARQAKGKKDL